MSTIEKIGEQLLELQKNLEQINTGDADTTAQLHECVTVFERRAKQASEHFAQMLADAQAGYVEEIDAAAQALRQVIDDSAQRRCDALTTAMSAPKQMTEDDLLRGLEGMPPAKGEATEFKDAAE